MFVTIPARHDDHRPGLWEPVINKANNRLSLPDSKIIGFPILCMAPVCPAKRDLHVNNYSNNISCE